VRPPTVAGIVLACVVLPPVRRLPGGGPIAAPRVVGDNPAMGPIELLLLAPAIFLAFVTWRTWKRTVWYCPPDDSPAAAPWNHLDPETPAPRPPVSPPIRDPRTDLTRPAGSSARRRVPINHVVWHRPHPNCHYRANPSAPPADTGAGVSHQAVVYLARS